jgi:hypothetical protein
LQRLDVVVPQFSVFGSIGHPFRVPMPLALLCIAMFDVKALVASQEFLSPVAT